MEAVFLKLLDMSITATWLVLAVLVLRFLLKKAPKWIHCCLWAMVAVRLLCPVSIESVLSLIPERSPAVEQVLVERNISTDSTAADQYELPQFTAESTAKLETQPASASGGPVQAAQPQSTTAILTGVWLAGIAVMVTYAFISYQKLSKRVAPSIALVENLYLCDYIESPFILGILRPKIYLPSDMDPNAAAHVLAHERAHIQRKDHWWKPLGFCLLTLHWFNPAMWLAYVLLCRDIELACDEKVIRNMGAVDKKSYSEALLSCSVPRHMIAACPLAFGEVGVKERVKSVLNYKKPTFWIILVAVLVLIVTAVCFLTDPVKSQENDVSEFFENYAYEQLKLRMTREEIHFIDAKDDFALVFSSGMGPELALYQYEMADGQPRILDSCSGEYTLSGGMSINHVEVNGRHIYFGTVSDSHFNMAEDSVEAINWSALRITDENGEEQELDMAEAQGFLAILDAPLADFAVVDKTNGVVLDYAAFLSQGYAVDERSFEADTSEADEPEADPYAPADTPYQWTRNVTAEDFWHGSASYLAYENIFTSYRLLDSQLVELAEILNQVRENEIITEEIIHDRFDIQGNHVYLGVNLEHGIHLSQQGDYVRVYTDEDSGLWEDLTLWFIDNEALEQWMEKLSYGGTYMLTHGNRAEVKEQLGVGYSYVEFFDPREYEDLLFVGCRYDDQSKVALAVFQSDENGGYTLLKVTPYEQLGICPSVPNIWWTSVPADSTDLTVFLVLNNYVTSMQWTGEFEAKVPIARTPGVVVVEVSEDTETEYRFLSGQVAAASVRIRDSRLLETIVEYSHGYANMQLPLPGSWEYEIVEHTDDQTPFGIRFRPEGEEGWLYLQFSPNGFGVCGTGLETVDMQIGIECRASVGYYDGSDIWSFIHFAGLPGDYVLLNDGADGWLSTYEEEVTQILNSSALAQGMAWQDLIETVALIHALDTGWTERVEGYDLKENYPEVTFETWFDFRTGIWTVQMTKSGSDCAFMCEININGLVLNEE